MASRLAKSGWYIVKEDGKTFVKKDFSENIAMVLRFDGTDVIGLFERVNRFDAMFSA